MLSEIGKEIWAEYAVAMTIMILRFVTRFRLIGWRGFDGTDLFCLIATIMYTMISVIDYLLSTPNYPTNTGLTPTTALEVPDELIPLYERGSKMVHSSWVIYICMIFSFKGVMLCLFHKVGTGVWRQELLVIGTTIFVTASWVASILAHLCACTPISMAWQVKPYPGKLCTQRPQNYYVAGVLNIVSDVIIMIIPVPLLWNLQASFRRKLALACLFCSGIFIICCTVLRTYYVFTNSLLQSTGVAWAGREGTVSMIVISAPGIWPLFRRSHWFSKSYQKSSDQENSGGRPRTVRTWKPNRRRTTSDIDDEEDDDVLSLRAQTPQLQNKPSSACGSEEQMVHQMGRLDHSGDETETGRSIAITTEYTVGFENASKVEDASALARHKMTRPEW